MEVENHLEANAIEKTIQVGEDSSIDIPNANKDLRIYPDPLKDELNIASSDIIEHLDITDMQGRTVFSINNLNANEIKIPIAQWLTEFI